MNIDRKFIAQRDADSDNSVIPLINVVFLMLIFFMVAGQIQKSDPIQVTPPNSINETRPENDPDAMIVMGANGDIYLNDDLVQLENIEQTLTGLFEGSADPQAFWVQIKADGDLDIASLRPLFSAIRRSGLTKVSVATQLGQGS